MIDVVLLSCDRLEYTRRTLASFMEHNKAPELQAVFRFWHCDDASTDPKVRELAARAFFKPLVYTDERVGVTEMVRRTARKLEHAGAEWMLLLENDWETVRPFPLETWREAVRHYDVWSMRLYGRYKERHYARPAGTRHRGRGGADPQWHTCGGTNEPFEVGHIHWGNPPAVSRVDLVAWLHKKARREKEAIVKSGEIQEPVARVVENVVFHIGAERTAGFVS